MTWTAPHRRRLMMTALLSAAGLFALPAPAQERLGVPDIIYQNGKIYTGKPGSFVQAVAVKDGRVLATGSAAQMKALAGAQTRIADLGGKTAIPGLYDNHVHVNATERRDSGTQVPDLNGIKNLADLQAILKAHAATVPKGTWIRSTVPHGTGDVEPFPEGSIPTRWQLDEATPDHPVALVRGAHILMTNSKALEIAGITRDTPQPPGGVIERAENGDPNGIMRETPARRIITAHYPPDPPLSDDQGLANLRNRLNEQLALGVTSLNIAGMRPGDDLRLMQTLYEKEGAKLPRATIQLRVSPGYDAFDDAEEGVKATIAEIEALSFRTGYGNDRVKLGAIKMSVDGGMGGQASWLVDEYRTRPGYHGVVRIPPDALYRVAKRAHELGWQLGIHAIGDQGIIRTVEVMDRIVKESPRPDARHYLHHITVKPPAEILAKIKENGFIAAMQPNFTHTMASFYNMALSPAKAQTNNPQQTFIKLGVPMSLGTDSLPDGPLVAIYGAVTRRGTDGKVYGPEERLTLDQAIYNATMGSAFMTFDEDNRGSLEPGKFADITVLDRDIFTIPVEDIRTLTVAQTIINGEVAWQSDGKPRPASHASIDERCHIENIEVHCHSGEDGLW